MVLLQGKLDIHFHAARGLKEQGVLNQLSESLFSMGKPTPDAFVNCYLGKNRVLRSKTKNDSSKPKWDEHSIIDVSHDVEEVLFKVKEEDASGNQTLGSLAVSAQALLDGQSYSEEWLELGSPDDPQEGQGDFGKLQISLTFTPVQQLDLGPEVPGTYFQAHRGCSVELFQDAHQEEGMLPDIQLDNGTFRAGSTWNTIYRAIQEAQRFIYICGWSVDTTIRLVRDGSDDRSLGELLIAKAEEGVKVVMMVWNDSTSFSAPFFQKKNGQMGTYDEATRELFQDTQVHCYLVNKNVIIAEGELENLAIGVTFTHHQKCVILDAEPVNSDKRSITAFVGGLDLTEGRYDTCRHPLFRGLGDTYRTDFMQHNATGISENYGPREPWEDIHSCLRGPVARDVLINFEERMQMQQPGEMEHMYNITEDEFELGREAVVDEDPSSSWVVQVFRSIDDVNAAFRETSCPETLRYNGHAVDLSIQRAYVHAIRRAQRFIYIENQYFLGSAFAWRHNTGVMATNLVPIEIARKVCSKILDGQDFAVYIILPMFPEGDPASDAVQSILKWQHNTIDMMFSMVANAINEAGSDRQPQDYLNFFCLGNRESEEGGEPLTDEPPEEGSLQETLLRTRRTQIYVHSKLIIIDDEYVMLGSANINNRSMEGFRDSEIAMGAWQEAYMSGGQDYSRGNVYGFRKSLFSEHLGLDGDESWHDDPSNQDCVQQVRQIARENWQIYTQDYPQDMRAHIMPYPYGVEQDGTVVELSDFPQFPDYPEGATVLGHKTMLPELLTT